MTVTRPVVVGLDGSKTATHAVQWAAEEAGSGSPKQRRQR
ncbi:universal stress protein [Lentzea sp. NPDC006480]